MDGPARKSEPQAVAVGLPKFQSLDRQNPSILRGRAARPRHVALCGNQSCCPLGIGRIGASDDCLVFRVENGLAVGCVFQISK